MTALPSLIEQPNSTTSPSQRLGKSSQKKTRSMIRETVPVILFSRSSITAKPSRMMFSETPGYSGKGAKPSKVRRMCPATAGKGDIAWVTKFLPAGQRLERFNCRLIVRIKCHGRLQIFPSSRFVALGKLSHTLIVKRFFKVGAVLQRHIGE